MRETIANSRAMTRMAIVASWLAFATVPAYAQAATPPAVDNYMMSREAEIALARTAAPATIASKATIKVLTRSGFEVAVRGDNGFVCMVMRGWSAPTYTPAQFRDLVYDATVRAPICFNPGAVRMAMPYYELRTELGLAGKSPDQIADALQAAYVTGRLPKRDEVSFAYMWSGEQILGGPIGHWHPHLMIFAPYYDNAMLGGNAFGAPLPRVTDDAGTPFAVVVIPVDDALAVHLQRSTHVGTTATHSHPSP